MISYRNSSVQKLFKGGKALEEVPVFADVIGEAAQCKENGMTKISSQIISERIQWSCRTAPARTLLRYFEIGSSAETPAARLASFRAARAA